jgi:SAM-dependent methyltransferase
MVAPGAGVNASGSCACARVRLELAAMDLREMQHAKGARHPWERARLHHFRSVITAARPLHAGAGTYLDVGSGDAWFANTVAADQARFRQSTAWDIGYSDANVRQRVGAEAPHVTLAAEQPAGPFDLITLLDVLEHVADAPAFLRQIVDKNLAVGGAMLISVPAWSALYCQHDRALGHYRRYDPPAAQQLLATCGLQAVLSGGLFHSLLLPRAAATLRERYAAKVADAAPEAMHWRGGRLATRFVDTVLRWDTAASRGLARVGFNMPGLSWWALCKKRA